jgi:hypothetical protein
MYPPAFLKLQTRQRQVLGTERLNTGHQPPNNLPFITSAISTRTGRRTKICVRACLFCILNKEMLRKVIV